MPSVPVEICVDSAAHAMDAWRAGAHRIEFCADLTCGGTTPDFGELREVCAAIDVPVVALVRARAGDFVYSAAEHDAMLRDIERVRQAGAAGVALGELTSRASVDDARVAESVDAARPMTVTFHRAFDAVAEPLIELERLIEIGVDRVLTSGGAAAAIEAVDGLRTLVTAARDRTVILLAGGVRSNHAAELLQGTRAGELHSSARQSGVFDVTEVRRLLAATEAG